MISTGNLVRTQVSVKRSAYEVYNANTKLGISCLPVCTHTVRAESEKLLLRIFLKSNLQKQQQKEDAPVHTKGAYGGGGKSTSPHTQS
jgi:hypothetical protein